MTHLTPANWLVVIILSVALSATTTLWLTKHRTPTTDLDVAVVVKVLAAADKYCKEMKARTFTVRASGLVVDGGCSKK